MQSSEGHRSSSPDPVIPLDRRVVSGRFLLTVAAITGLIVIVFAQNLDAPLKWAVLAISIVPIFTTVYHRLLFLKGWFLHRDLFSSPRLESARRELPGLALLVASCEEPFEVAKMTFDCAYNARYTGTREVIVVDNSLNIDDAGFRMWKSYVEMHAGRNPRVRITFRHNADSAGKKPGNIDLALKLITNSEYVAFLDVDSSLPLERDLLDFAVNEFLNDPKLGVLQLHTVPTNSHFNRLSRAVAVAQLALRMSSLMRASGGFAMFYGHNAIWRRSLLDMNGPWLEHYRDNVMVTEDLLKTLGVYRHGFVLKYVNAPTGEWVPSSLKSLESMWMRWTYGGFQVLFKYFRPIVTAQSLSFTQRVDLMTMLVGYGTSPLVYPLTFLWFATFSAAQAAVLTFVILWLPPLFCFGIMWRQHGGTQRAPILKRLGDLYAGIFLIETFILAVQTRAAANFIAGKKQGWQVTSKSAQGRPRVHQVLFDNMFLVGLSGLGVAGLIAGWGWFHGFAVNAVVSYAVLALVPVQLIVFVIVYGGQVQGADEDVNAAIIDPGT